MNFYLSENGQKLGPYSVEQIQIFLKQGLVSRSDQVWADGWPSWMQIGNVSELITPTNSTKALPKANLSIIDIIKSFFALVAGAGVLLAGFAAIIMKFVHSEHSVSLIRGGYGAARLAAGVDREKSTIWPNVIKYACAFLILGVLGFLSEKASLWYAKRCLRVGDENARRGDHNRAIHSYDTAIRQCPEYALAYHNRGLAEIALGQLERAEKDFNRARELDSSQALLKQKSS